MKGMTLIEVLLAVVVLSTGVLAAASAAAVVANLVAQGRRATQAATLAAERLETLRSQPCASLSGGTALLGDYQVTWTVASTLNGRGRRVLVTLAWPTARAVHAETFASTFAC
ncbi:MAG: prepilin-type N-terminal cleavage/methylation domain-containing protein [Gemmatimonadetes bacterium]|nr:prepilin-type N-terminal cleavage/methylation domain-containing protein [Gemmatimonadota bacterium]